MSRRFTSVSFDCLGILSLLVSQKATVVRDEVAIVVMASFSSQRSRRFVSRAGLGQWLLSGRRLFLGFRKCCHKGSPANSLGKGLAAGQARSRAFLERISEDGFLFP